jgi:hypothetical protein
MRHHVDSMKTYSARDISVLQRAPRSKLLLLKRHQVLFPLLVMGIVCTLLGFWAGRASGAVPGSSVSMASWYGPGLYGNHLGCGGTLTTGTYGVAHKSMACGTRLVVCFHRRCTRVRVVDRGPFVAGREFDLTGAVAMHLRFNGAQPIRWWRARHPWR